MGYYTNETTRIEIDCLLKENARLGATLGKDSTKEERDMVINSQKTLFNLIKNLDPEIHKVLVYESIHDINHSC